MQAHRIDTKVASDGSVTVRDLPFRAGEDVEVIILPRHAHIPQEAERTSLLGSVRRYEQPFEPAMDAEDWEAM